MINLGLVAIGAFTALAAVPILRWFAGAVDVDDPLMTFKQNVIWMVIAITFLSYFMYYQL